MHCLKSLRKTNPGILQLFKNAGSSARVGADNIVLSRTQQPVHLPCWAAASPHTHRAFHHQGPDVDQGHSKSRLMSSMEDLLFYTITEGKEMIPLSQFISALRKTGLLTSDPRLRDCVHQLRKSTRDSVGPVMMDKTLFRRCAGNNIMLLTKAFKKKFIIPDFAEFT
ncbi:Glutaminase liver isoform, mitochondrial [Larimichthys crocea]|nr:Glutaminase liver isoform, mitochondrial [Larimichthys crocea]